VLSIILPTLNAQTHLGASLAALMEGVWAGLVREVIITDGGSSDATLVIADDAGCTIVEGPKGRGAQLILGAQQARGAWLLFLHADTVLAPGWVGAVRAFIAKHGDKRAGYFRFQADQDTAAGRHLAFWVQARCATFALPYGDQGLLLSRALYDAVGGFRPLPLMEDVDLVRRLGRGRLSALAHPAVTSVARHVREGYLKRSAKNLLLLSQFLAGADPHTLARRYE
jgi:rSAM/selenodomain-associated transferase 2